MKAGESMTLDITCTDMFCGAGGSTTGATLAGATVKLAINHWARAVETHNRNYPNTLHALTDLHTASPKRFPRTTILIASPECTSHSLAKGISRYPQPGQRGTLWEAGKLDEYGINWQEEAYLNAMMEERSRCTMWTPLDWAEYHDYQAIILENVVDAHLWRPFQAWLQAWKSLDYEFELVYLNSMHAHPTPQSRDRMYFVAWKKGNRKPNLKITPQAYCQKCEKDVNAVQCWKNPDRRYGKYKQQYIYACPTCAAEVTPYYYAAINAIDWSLPAPRIGDRTKPLREKTMQRIEYGLKKFAGEPFTVEINKTSDRIRSLHGEPFPTQTGVNGLAMVTPFITELHGFSKARPVTEPLATVCAGGQHHGLVVPPFLLNLNHPNVRATSVTEQPFPTQTAYDDNALVVPPFIMDHLGEYRPRPITGPFSTICASGNHQSLVTPPAWLMSYYNNGQLVPVSQTVPTVTTLDRCALVTGTDTGPIAVEDCGFRMLVPDEIKAAMAFPADYIITGTRREQVKQLGNAVTPPAMRLLMERIIASLAGSDMEAGA
jgi:DNA (cytosine-5)-methyltransferase 1